MNKLRYLYMSNEILGINLIANLIGRAAAEVLGRTILPEPLKDSVSTYQTIEMLFRIQRSFVPYSDNAMV